MSEEKVCFKITVESGAWLDRLLNAVEALGRIGATKPSTADKNRRESDKWLGERAEIAAEIVEKMEPASPPPVHFNGLICSICGFGQYKTPSGTTCPNGHDGANGEEPETNDITTIGEWVVPPALEPPTPTEPPAAGVELADGIPHDIRIHASTRTKYAKAPHGWKLKRGVDPELVKTVEAELRAAMALPVPEITDAEKAFGMGTEPAPIREEHISAAAVPPAPAAVIDAAVIDAAVAAVVPIVSGELPPPPAATTPAAGSITTFAQLIVALTAAKLDQTVIDAALASVGLESMALLGARPDLIPAIATKLFPGA